MDTYARTNAVKDKLRRGQSVFGMEVWLRDPRVLELLAQSGYDFVQIENEHVANDWEKLENAFRTAQLLGMTPVFRTEQCFEGKPPANQIIKALKAGAQIIKVPHVETAGEAALAVAAARYAPAGKRGVATCDRSAREIPSSADGPLDIGKWVRDANDEISVWTLIETPEGVANADEICAVDGVDVVGFGHQDFAIAAGLDRDNAPQVAAAREKVLSAALRHGKQMYVQSSDPGTIQSRAQQGLRVFVLRVDLIHLNDVFRDLITIRGTL